MLPETISIRGARANNLKNVDVDIPKNKLTVITGLSGSGKSSLAFDTIYAEGQRRYAESLSNYARRFLGVIEKPAVDSITGLSPTIAIDQRGITGNARSTVGTITEVYDYLRLLFSKIGQPYCPHCGKAIARQDIYQMAREVLTWPKTAEVLILAPWSRGEDLNLAAALERAKAAGRIKIRFQKVIYGLKDLELAAPKWQKAEDLALVVDKIYPAQDKKALIKALEMALSLSGGSAIVQRLDNKKDFAFSQNYTCAKCGYSLAEMEPHLFSFNSPAGACPACQGLGTRLTVEPKLLVPNPNLTIAQGAIRPLARLYSAAKMRILEQVAQRHGFDLNTPVKNLSARDLKYIFYGTGEETYEVTSKRDPSTPPAAEFTLSEANVLRMTGSAGNPVKFAGVVSDLETRHREAKTDYLRREIEKYMLVSVCEACHGRRLKPEVLNVKIAGQNIAQFSELCLEKLREFFTGKHPWLDAAPAINREVARPIYQEIHKRLNFLGEVGLDYLTLDRASTSLSGGEAQRIKLATQLGALLSGVTYVLDEPTVGLHPRDIEKLMGTIRKLIEQGNTAIVVEHDSKTMEAADKIIDLGPGAGEYGGEIVAQGTLADLKRAPRSLTGQYFNGTLKIPVPTKRRAGNGKSIKIFGARAHNLKNIDVNLPLGKLICVTGVSGSGKSSLMLKTLAPALAKKFYGAKELPAEHKKITDMENIDKLVSIDQSPIGRSPHSNPATYTGVFTAIRDLFAALPESRARHYNAGHFSFNVAGGRCEACKGEGAIKVEMQFLPSVFVKCEECGGTRYNRDILDICYQEKNIAQILDLPIAVAKDFFADIPNIANKLKILNEVGLGYLKLGQPAPTLSGGEAQRIKLASELSRKATGQTLYLLDEPTTGLHIADIKRLLEVLEKLVESGNTVLVIEHNLEVIKCADWVIDLGPEGGAKGGQIVAQGTPEEVARVKNSYTGQYLKGVLGK